ncbi:MAG: hypothetical protein F4Z29_13540 [Gemmatimonadetes bacterium]|nr:hypothetical protein [Gemmatimonadota bacterium]
MQPSTTAPGAAGKFKHIAFVLAAMFGPFAWLYTYKTDKGKFWLAGLLNAPALIVVMWSPHWLGLDYAAAGETNAVADFFADRPLAYLIGLIFPIIHAVAVINVACKPPGYYERYPDGEETEENQPPNLLAADSTEKTVG